MPCNNLEASEKKRENLYKGNNRKCRLRFTYKDALNSIIIIIKKQK